MESSEFEAVVVGSTDLGDSDRILRLLSAEHGRTSVVVRNARSSKKRWVGVTDLGHRSRFSIRFGPKDLDSLRAADPVQGPRLARVDLDRIAALAYGCELVAAFSPEREASPRHYGLLVAWLQWLESEGPLSPLGRLALEAKVLTFAGLTPALLRCARCGSDLDDPAAFHAEAGGAVHQRCSGGGYFSVSTGRMLEACRRTPLLDLPMGRPQPEIRWILGDFAQWHLGRSLQSRTLVEELERMPGTG